MAGEVTLLPRAAMRSLFSEECFLVVVVVDDDDDDDV